MSSRAVKQVFRVAPDDLGPAAMLLLVTLGDSVNEEWDWTYVPGVTKLAEKAHLSDRAARDAVVELVRRGLVEKPPRGRTQPLRLTLFDPRPAADAASTGSRRRFSADAPLIENQSEPGSAREATDIEPSSDAWAVVNTARTMKNVILYRADVAAREVQKLLDAEGTRDDLIEALAYMNQKVLTAGTLGIALSKYRLARTRERDAEQPARSYYDRLSDISHTP